MDVFDLFAKISLDTGEYERGLEGASEKSHSFANALKAGLSAAAKGAAVAIGAATAAVGALAKASLDSYGEYEQLVGGVETLFKDSAGMVTQYADNAYKTAGLSANQYMETVTSFSASLLQSLGGDTAAAAQMADLAITDMADNANKMGTDIEMLQNAYRGFARGNFTMLDNLALGYAGTKEEMERLLADAEKLSGVEYDISSYADMVEAIHVVQTEMGITGTTAAEAASTIQGSMSAAKSAFQNLITGIADGNANLDTLIGNFVDSVKTAGDNVIPRVEQILVGLGQAIQALAPMIAEQLPPLVEAVLPSLLSAGTDLLSGLLAGIISALPMLVEAAPQVVDSLWAALSEGWPAIRQAGVQLLDMLTTGITENLPSLIEQGLALMLDFSSSLREGAGNLVEIGMGLLQKLMEGIVEALPALIETAPLIVSNIAGIVNDNAPKLLETAASLIGQLATGLLSNIPVIIANIPQIIAAICDTITAFNWINLGKTMIGFFAKGIGSAGGKVLQGVKNTLKAGIDWLEGLPNQAVKWGTDMIEGLANGIMSKAHAILDGVKNIAGGIRSFLHFSRPDEGPLRDYESWMPDFMLGLARGIDANAWRVEDALESLAGNIRDSFAAPFSASILAKRQNAVESIPAQRAAGAPFGDTFNITVNGAKYSDEQGLARYIAQEIQYMQERRRAAFATA